jgi:Photosynthesis affected mutant 68
MPAVWGCIIVLLLVIASDSFSDALLIGNGVCRRRWQQTALSAKGFGKSKASPPVGDNSTPSLTTDSATTIGSGTAETSINTAASPSSSLSASALSADEAIKSTKMFKSKQARDIYELDEKIKKLKEEEALIASDPSVGAVPEIVADRMIGRIAAFFGIPVFGGLAIFVGAFFYYKKYDVVVPPTIIAYATQLPFVLGLLGITYAIVSSSWDEVSDDLVGMGLLR